MVDGFGDRLLMFDNTETDSLELLRFHPSLAATAGFEDALHERVHQVGRLPDHAFPLIVAVERLEGDGALALVSTHVPGKRLSAFFDKPGPRRGLNPSFVTGVVTQSIQALTVLQSKGDDIAHSVLTPERLVITTGGRVCVVEHVLGSALRQLDLSAGQLWRDFGLVTPSASSGVSLDARTDVFQLAVLAFSMLLGRRLTPLELKDRLPELLDQWSETAARSQVSGERLSHWLERALQISDHSYASAEEAYGDLRDMPTDSAASAFDALPQGESEPAARPLQLPGGMTRLEDYRHRSADGELTTLAVDRVDETAGRRPFGLVHGQETPMANAAASGHLEHDEHNDSDLPAASALIPSERRWTDAFSPEEKSEDAGPRLHMPPPATPAATRTTTVAAPPAAAATVERKAVQATLTRKPIAILPLVAGALGVVALVEAVVIVTLLTRGATAPAAQSTPAAASVAEQPVVAPAPAPAPAPVPPVAVDEKRKDDSAAIAEAAGNQRSGGVRLQAPIELKVLQGDRVLGSTADGAIVAKAGTYQLDLVNTAVGFRVRRAVTFRPGEIVTVDVSVPPGRLSVNAQPWAEVLIDNRSYGETPLANLNVPLGDHEIVFRHPQLGERRQTVTVRADAVTRVSTSFDR